MHFEVTHSKMNEGKGYMGETKARVERSYKLLNEVYNCGMFNGGSFGNVGNSMGVLLQRLAAERNECAMLENGLASIANIYLNLDSSLTGNSLMDNVTPDTQLDPDMVESITSFYSGGVDVPGKNAGRHGGGGRRIDSLSRGRQGRGGGSGGGSHLRGAVSREQFEEDYIVVDSMDYLPLSDSWKEIVYTGYYDKEGVWHEPLNDLHDSAEAADWKESFKMYGTAAFTFAGGAVFDALGLTSGDLLLHYYTGGGKDYIYDGVPLLQNPTVNSIFQDHVKDVAMACDGNIADGETIIIANTPGKDWQGCPNFIELENGLPQWLNVGANFNTLCTLGGSQSGIVCEVTRVDDQYIMKYSYYLVDYYDFDSFLLEPMYNMNRYGYGTNYMAYGKISGVATWSDGSDVVVNVPAVMPDVRHPLQPIADLSPLESPDFLPGV